MSSLNAFLGLAPQTRCSPSADAGLCPGTISDGSAALTLLAVVKVALNLLGCLNPWLRIDARLGCLNPIAHLIQLGARARSGGRNLVSRSVLDRLSVSLLNRVW